MMKHDSSKDCRGLFLVNDTHPPPPNPHKLVKLDFSFLKMRNVLKRMQKQFSDFF